MAGWNSWMISEETTAPKNIQGYTSCARQRRLWVPSRETRALKMQHRMRRIYPWLWFCFEGWGCFCCLMGMPSWLPVPGLWGHWPKGSRGTRLLHKWPWTCNDPPCDVENGRPESDIWKTNESILADLQKLRFRSGRDLGFSRGGGFSKKNSKILSTFVLGRPNWFSELSQSNKKTPFWPKFLCRRHKFKKKQAKNAFQKCVFGTFWNILT